MMYCSALVQALQSGQESERCWWNKKGHGRDVFDDVDLSRTIGWFTTIFPVVLKLEGASHPSDALKAVKDQRNIPNRGSAMVCSAI